MPTFLTTAFAERQVLLKEMQAVFPDSQRPIDRTGLNFVGRQGRRRLGRAGLVMAGPLHHAANRHRRRLSWRAALLAAQLTLPTPVLAESPCPPQRPPFALLRSDETYTFLANPACRTEFWDPIKYIALHEPSAPYLSLGGEARLRYEYFNNALWGQGPQDDSGYFLQRYFAHGDLHLGTYLRLFGQLQSSLEDGRTGGPRPTDEDRLDLHQGFIDVIVMPRTNLSVTLRTGRQEFAFGSERLVTVREGPNVRLSFDALRLIVAGEQWRVDGFVSRPVSVDRGVFDNDADPSRAFWGVYLVAPLPLIFQGHADLYYLGLNRELAQFDQGIADEHRHTVGARLWGRPGAWDYNFEAVYQWGRFGAGDIQAWSVASDTGYTVHSAPTRPRLSLKADIVSGDRDPNDRELQSLNPLFPKGNYFGEIALLGPVNLIDVHPSVELRITPALSVTADWAFFWRESVRDGVYGTAGNLLRSGRTSRARFIGQQPTLMVQWRVDRHLVVIAEYTHFFAGDFIRETGPGKDIDYLSAWVTYKF